jgi:acyl-CoA thioesterase FadM
MIFRTILTLIAAQRRSALHIHDVGRIPLRVLPTDLDILGHMNNGIYPSIMDLGRMDLLIRAGAWATMRRLGIYPVVVSETISFRKSLQPWQKFVLESRVAGYDNKAAFLEQRFVVAGEIYAQGFIRGRFVKKSGGTVTMAELAEVLGVDLSSMTLPPWIERWSADVALPASRAEAPSDWGE